MVQVKMIPLAEQLARQRRAAEEREARRAAAGCKLPYLDLTKIPIDVDALALVDEKEAREARLVSFQAAGKELGVAVIDPSLPKAQAIVENLKKRDFIPTVSVVSASGLEYAFGFYRFVVKREEGITGRVDIAQGRIDELAKTLKSLPDLKKAIAEFKSPYVSQILEIVLAGALANHASDIHLEPSAEKADFRLRMDGLLHEAAEIQTAAYESLVTRIKLLSNLKINIHDEAQDGRFTIGAGKAEIEIRTSVIPSEFGETIVLRILDPAGIHVTLADLGLRSDDLKIVTEELNKPNGMILNTGPTGSGKTTTLYTFLQTVYEPESKIITIEDPIEYHLEGIEQTQVNAEAGYTFANGLRSILRQDPDIILVGEIRDLETAEIAMHSALTGHLVFSTLHANSAVGAIPRLIDLGVRPSIIAPSMNLVIAQRLVRRLCQNCRVPAEIGADLKKKIGKFVAALPPRVNHDDYKEAKIFSPKGCEQCNNFGYRGRVAIYELLLIDPAVEELIAKEPTELDVEKLAFKQGMTTMQEDGILKAIVGVTTFDEVERLTGPLRWRE
ncbi:MAG: type II/IV secretion system protein [Parcubacteria group bacterium]|nr:type II/IV secretion system protein [Parcubacteria group bacterium]